ncbi:MAG: DUF5615 family PIN-like protein [Pyrinomonadaceae bacterium]
MKLLFDQNLSPRLINLLSNLFPGSDHIYRLGLDQASDKEIWEYAMRERFIIVTRDADFSDLCMLLGFPPKVIWIRRGNCTTRGIELILRNHFDDVNSLNDDELTGVLTLF